MRKWFSEQENKIEVFVFLVLMITVCSPLITKFCINGHDLEYHLLRIESLKEAILMGRPFGKINVLFFGGAGYASSLFYPDLLLYIPALLRVMGFGINSCYHIYTALCMILTYLSTRYCVKQMTRSTYGAIMAGILMVSAPYYLGDVFIRGAVGEYTAFIFLPFVIYGIYNTIYERMDRPFILGIGFAGVLLCHTNTFVFCLLFAFVAFIVKWKNFKENPVAIRRLFATAGVTACLTMFYWLPVMEMIFTTGLYVNHAWITLEESAMQFSCIFSMTFPGLGFLLIILAFFRVLVKKNAQNRNLIAFSDWLLIGGSFFAILATDLIPWEKLNNYLSFVQFPWRFFVLATAMFAVADAIILSVFIKSSLEPYMPSSNKVLAILLLVVSAAFAFRFISNADITYYDYSDDYYSHKPFTANVIAGEWLPDTVENPGQLVKDSEHLIADNGDDLPFERIRDRVETDLNADYGYVDVPFVFYRGYKASITGAEGTKELQVTPGQNGLCRVSTDGQKGHLVVKYGGTALQHLSLIISLLTLIAIIVFSLYKKKKSKAVGG